MFVNCTYAAFMMRVSLPEGTLGLSRLQLGVAHWATSLSLLK